MVLGRSGKFCDDICDSDWRSAGWERSGHQSLLHCGAVWEVLLPEEVGCFPVEKCPKRCRGWWESRESPAWGADGTMLLAFRPQYQNIFDILILSLIPPASTKPTDSTCR